MLRFCKAFMIIVLWVYVGLHASAEQISSVCDLLLSPKQYAHRDVTLKARLESDGIERFVLVDPKCDYKRVKLVFSGTPEDDKVMSTIFKGRPGTFDKVICVTLVGRFVGHNRRFSTFTLEKAVEVSSSPKPSL